MNQKQLQVLIVVVLALGTSAGMILLKSVSADGVVYTHPFKKVSAFPDPNHESQSSWQMASGDSVADGGSDPQASGSKAHARKFLPPEAMPPTPKSPAAEPEIEIHSDGFVVDRTTGLITVYDDQGNKLGQVDLDESGWRYMGSAVPGSLVFVNIPKKDEFRAVVIDHETASITRQGEYEGNPGGYSSACGGRIYSPYPWGFFEVPEIYALSGIDGSSTTIVVPKAHESPDYKMEIEVIECLDDEQLLVRTLESIKPNNLEERTDRLWFYNIERGEFQALTEPQNSAYGSGFTQILKSNRHSGTFYTYEHRGWDLWEEGPVVHTIKAFRNGKVLWSTDLPQSENANAPATVDDPNRQDYKGRIVEEIGGMLLVDVFEAIALQTGERFSLWPNDLRRDLSKPRWHPQALSTFQINADNGEIRSQAPGSVK